MRLLDLKLQLVQSDYVIMDYCMDSVVIPYLIKYLKSCVFH